MKQNFETLKLYIRGWLSGAGMYTALRAVNLGLEWHNGVRKDGVTPEYTHQLSQIEHARSLTGIADLEPLICVIALHDIVEDKPYELDNIRADFGATVAEGVRLMSKKVFGTNADQSDEHYYWAMEKNPHASIAKGCDRVHNQSSMVGVFDIPKQIGYLNHTNEFIIPMLKQARKRYSHQEVAYTALIHRLREQDHLIRGTLKAVGRWQELLETPTPRDTL